ncbi:MAG: hypothetical protein CMJ64_11790 [Planctomycetaceae bacterium]|nr:hypothetical protein [Planctomycetaceae bacterium]
MRFSLTGCFYILIASTACLAADNTDLPPTGSVQPLLVATGFEFADGPAFDKQGNLYVVNYRGNGNIGRITKDGTASVWSVLSEVAPLDSGTAQANGLKVDTEGRLLVADSGGGRLLRLSADGKRAEVLADRFGGERFKAVNDLALDTKGNVYFTDPGDSDADHPTGAVYGFDISTASTSRLVADLAFPNGLAVTPDQKSLCVGESARFRILIYDLADGEATNGRELIRFPKADADGVRGGDHSPDGMIFDTAARLYVAMWTAGVINVVDVATGKLLRQYDAGGSKVTNCHFFGTSLYTTVAAKEAVFRLDLGVPGFEYNPQ